MWFPQAAPSELSIRVRPARAGLFPRPVESAGKRLQKRKIRLGSEGFWLRTFPGDRPGRPLGPSRHRKTQTEAGDDGADADGRGRDEETERGAFPLRGGSFSLKGQLLVDYRKRLS